MPIYMDRHDVSETVTAENIAYLHQKDLKIQDQFACKGLTYWFDDKRKTAFCLVEAPNKEALKKMHDRAHGQVPHRIIEVDPSIVESFLGRIEDPVRAQNTGLNIINDPAFRTIMVISLSQLNLKRKDSSDFRASFRKFNQAVRKLLVAYEGNTVEQTDYRYLASFKSVTNAIHAAFDIRSLCRDFGKHLMKERIIFKIGLSAGVPVTKKQLIFEDSIKLAERMCEMVNGEIIISAEVRDLYESENLNSFIKGKGVFSLAPADEKFITLLMDYIEAAWMDSELKLNDFVKPVGCSKSQLYRNMKSLTGKAPNTFIKEYRLKAALKLLRKNSGNVSEIAFQTGFSSPSYFTKCFKEMFGVLPAIFLNTPQ